MAALFTRMSTVPNRCAIACCAVLILPTSVNIHSDGHRALLVLMHIAERARERGLVTSREHDAKSLCKQLTARLKSQSSVGACDERYAFYRWSLTY
jgi:hypothetical protein